LPHDGMHKRGLCRHVVCVCVCLSVTFVDHVQTNKDIFEILSPSGSHTILVFPFFRFSKRDGDISTGTPLTGASDAFSVGRNLDSEHISGFSACC